MKKFLKKYLWIFIYCFICVALIFLATVWVGFLIVGSIGLGSLCLYFAFKSRKKYNSLKEYDDSDQYIDARKYDYDEDIYYIGDPDQRDKKRAIGKGFFSKMNAMLPTVTFSLFGVGLILIAVVGIVKIFIGF
ncbi:MAG: hypothetical protein IJB10_04340 [Clostridia bacterium]|nr:hypothetical protein [Clostridia bacterium]